MSKLIKSTSCLLSGLLLISNGVATFTSEHSEDERGYPSKLSFNTLQTEEKETSPTSSPSSSSPLVNRNDSSNTVEPERSFLNYLITLQTPPNLHI